MGEKTREGDREEARERESQRRGEEAGRLYRAGEENERKSVQEEAVERAAESKRGKTRKRGEQAGES